MTSRTFRRLAISATASLALLSLTNFANASLVLVSHTSDAPPALAEQAPKVERQAALEPDTQKQKDVQQQDTGAAQDANEDAGRKHERHTAHARRIRGHELSRLFNRRIRRFCRGWRFRL